jgi:hypothetical protein
LIVTFAGMIGSSDFAFLLPHCTAQRKPQIMEENDAHCPMPKGAP